MRALFDVFCDADTEISLPGMPTDDTILLKLPTGPRSTIILKRNKRRNKVVREQCMEDHGMSEVHTVNKDASHVSFENGIRSFI